MKTLPWLVVVLVALAWHQGVAAQEEPKGPPSTARALAALPYLSSTVPEQRVKAEKILEAAAPGSFDKLVEELPRQSRQGREILLRILANTSHGGRVRLCVDTLTRQEAQRVERVIAVRALESTDTNLLLDTLLERLRQKGLEAYARSQCQILLGHIPGARAQGQIEQFLLEAKDSPMESARLEVALLRSILQSGASEPAWTRWQRRRPEGPRCTLRELRDALAALARPTALERLEAEARLAELVQGNVLVLLAMAGSSYAERAAFGLGAVRRVVPESMQLSTLAAMLDLVSSAEQDIALLAIDVAVACAPPTPEELDLLRPMCSADAVARLESVIQGLGRGGNLAELRKRHARISAELRPLLQRKGALDPQARAIGRDLAQVRAQLDYVETAWREGWQREFESEVLGTGRAS